MLSTMLLLAQMQGQPCIPAPAIKQILNENQIRSTFIMEDNDGDRWTHLEHPNDGSGLVGFYQKTDGSFCVVGRRSKRPGV